MRHASYPKPLMNTTTPQIDPAGGMRPARDLLAMFERFTELSTPIYKRVTSSEAISGLEERARLLRDIPEQIKRLSAFAEVGTDALLERHAGHLAGRTTTTPGSTAEPASMELLRKAWQAACAFIDSHVADPDITPSMAQNYESYLALRHQIEVPAKENLTDVLIDIASTAAKKLE